MATSGSIDYNLTAYDIISKALRLIQVIGPGDDIEGEDYDSMLDILNMMIKQWQSQGLHVWTAAESTLLLEEGQASYTLYGSSTDHACVSTDFIKTEIATAAVSGATSLTVDSTSGMLANDVIGIEQDDGTIKWTTIATVPTSTTLTINSALTDDAAADNNVYTYTTLLQRPIDIKNTRYVYDDGTTYVLRVISRAEFYGISNRANTEGPPNMCFIDYQKDRTIMHVYPTPNESADHIEFTSRRIIEDFDSSTNDPDFPQEWLMAIVYNLAVAGAPIYAKEDKVSGLIATLAAQYLDAMKNFSQERSSLKIGPKIGW